MKVLVAYSSRTGNTRVIAEAIHSVMPAGAELTTVGKAPDPAGHDLIALGFWVDKGEPDDATAAFMDRMKGQNVGLFCTLGTRPDSEYARESMQKAVARLDGNNVLGTFVCQGKVEAMLATMLKTPSNPHPAGDLRGHLGEAEKHPNEADCEAARKVFAGIVQRLAGPGAP
jgi:flavodoxin